MKRRDFLVGSATALGSGISACVLGTEPENKPWSTWRGPRRDGIVDGQKWPASLEGDSLTKLWSQPLGDSYSGPVTCGETVFTTDSKAGKETTYGFSVQSGEPVWQQTWKGAHNVPFFAARNGNWIRSTPATDESSIYVGGIRDVVVAMNTKDGSERWRVDFAEKSGKVPDFGMVCSPLIDGGFLYVQAGKGLHKMNCSDGSILWSSLADSGDIMSSGSFSSPIIAELNGVRQLVVQTRTYLTGVNLETGEPYWRYDVAAFRGMNILTPTIWNNAIFTSSYGGKSILIDVVDNKKPTIRWENKIEAYMSSPLVINDHLYMHLKNKRFACIDLSMGKETWVTKPFGEYWSTLTDGEKILALDQDGTLRLIQSNPRAYTQLSERKVTSDEEESWAHVAVLPQKILVRSQKALIAFRWA